MMVAQDGNVDKSKGIAHLADELVSVVRAAASKVTPMHDVERDVLTRVLAVRRSAKQSFGRGVPKQSLGTRTVGNEAPRSGHYARLPACAPHLPS